MPQLSLPCPHCLSEKVGFAPRGSVSASPGSGETLIFLQCEACSQGIIAAVRGVVHHEQPAMWIMGQTSAPGVIRAIYPEKMEPKCPNDVPSPVSAAYLSGLRNLKRTDTNAAAMMFRRSIEIATKIIPDALKSGTLQKRIDVLPPDIATPAMKEWAHHIRLDANEATHEVDEFTEDEAKKLQLFTEMFLTYAFTLPAMLPRAKGEAS
jgi:hypothetical protein